MIRDARPNDAEEIVRIYTPAILNCSVSFELSIPTVDEMASRMGKASEKFPWIVWVDDGQVRGYAYATQFRSREAYRYSAETTVYVSPEHHRRGIGRALMSELLARLTAQSHHLALALITLPNDGSVGLHESLEFAKIGTLPEVGFKQEKWHDVGIWCKKLS